MGYDIHITRSQDWSDTDGPTITIEEWTSLIQNDPELRLASFARANLESESGLRTEDPTMAVWIGHPEHGKRENLAWLCLSQGNIDAKYPDKETIRKMWRIAQSLSAKVQGDDTELYGADGEIISTQSHDQPEASDRNPWWKFW